MPVSCSYLLSCNWIAAVLTYLAVMACSQQLYAQTAPASLPQQDSPAIVGVAFDPPSPATGDTLSAVLQGDASNRDAVDVFYEWKINGELVQESRDALLKKPIKRGDFIELRVVPADSSVNLRPLATSTTVGNAPPTLKLASQGMDSNSRQYRAHIEAVDPEGDPVTFSLKSSPEGMEIDPKGDITWTIKPDMQGSFPVQVSARDKQGDEATLTYQIKAHWESPQGVEQNANSANSSQ